MAAGYIANSRMSTTDILANESIYIISLKVSAKGVVL